VSRFICNVTLNIYPRHATVQNTLMYTGLAYWDTRHRMSNWRLSVDPSCCRSASD